jgi:hypothetical protein
VSAENTPPHPLLLLGEAEARYGAFRLETLPSGRVACALSVGADPTSPAMAHKGNPAMPNEDALLAMESGERVLLAVADAHYGTFASHALLRALAETLGDVPASPMDLERAVRLAALEGPAPEGDSASTLLLVVLRRDMGAGFGFCWGDSTCASVGGSHDGRALCQPNEGYLNPALPWTLGAERASFFEFDLPQGGLVLAFTDGIDECHYRRKETSLGPAQFLELFEDTGPEPKVYAKRLAKWALGGVDGHPGGQDNLALVVART